MKSLSTIKHSDQKTMNEQKKRRLPLLLSLQSSLQQNHLVYCSPTALPATGSLHTSLEVLIFFWFCLCERRYVETPGHSSGCRAYLIPALARPCTPGPKPQQGQGVSQVTATFEKPQGYLDDLRYAH